VLVAEDNVINQTIVVAMLEGLGCHVELGSMVPELQLESSLRTPAIDAAALQQLEEQLGDGGRALLEQLVRNFADDVTGVCARMTELLSRGDGEALAFEAHRLQSAAAYLSAGDLARDCVALERAARAGQLSSARQLLARLAHEYKGAQRALEAYVRAPRPNAAAK
jgi:HPt (histidine-containing phosphotransfer) domain-containing protein